MLIQPLLDPTDPRMPDPQDMALARSAAEILCDHYPGWTWAVNAEAKLGILSVFNAALTGNFPWGMRVKLGEADTPERWKRAIVNAGGELLERFGCPRGPMTESALASRKAPDVVVAEARAERLRQSRMKLVVGGARG